MRYGIWAHSIGRVAAVIGALAVASLAGAARGEEPWPTPVKDHVPVKPGEHPRLFFRRADLPTLRKRAATPEGKRIIERTIELLDGAGEVRPAGRYTIWDGAAYGFLYQMTAEAKYAELARGSVDAAIAGRSDRDKRYGVNPPNEPMRAGPSLAAIALAYDLAYDGWPEDYRLQIAKWMQTWEANCVKRGGAVSLRRLSVNPDNPNPVSNHFALQVGGAGLTVLALKGDPGVDAALIAACEQGVLKNARKVMTEDFGEAGYFHEHAGPGVIASTWTFMPWLKAERVAAGRDWLSHPDHPNAEWITLRFVMQTVSNGQGPFYMNPAWGAVGKNPGYGSDYLEQNMGSHATYWSAGFGAIQDKHVPAMLWTYKTFVAPTEFKRYPELGQKPSFDIFRYPHRGVFAMANWPFDVVPQNPGEVLSKVAVDKRMGQYVFRNRWQDSDDIVVMALFGARSHARSDKALTRFFLRAFGERIAFGKLSPAKVDHEKLAADGSGIVAGGGTCIAVDFSNACGAPGLVVMVGKGATGQLRGTGSKIAQVHQVQAGGTAFALLTLTNKAHPQPKVVGDTVVIGKQAVAYAQGRLSLSVMMDAKP